MTNKKNIILVFGTPCSGSSLVTRCLRILGYTPNTRNHINSLFFQDMQLDPLMFGTLPSGWHQTQTAAKAKERIENLLHITDQNPKSCVFSDPIMCRVLPLWLEVFQEKHIETKCIFVIRHPWETALSLASGQNMDLFKGHLVWLVYFRDAFRSLQNINHSMITYDQLLADPITTLKSCLPSSYFSTVESCQSTLLNFIQPKMKKHHAIELTKKDKRTFRAYEQIYQNILSSQNSNHPITQPSMHDHSESDLIESLLDVIDRYENKTVNISGGKHGLITISETGLFCRVTFPFFRKGNVKVEEICLIEDQWHKICLSVPDPISLRTRHIVFSPLNTYGTVKISSVCLVNQADGKALWELKKDRDFDEIILEDSLIRLPGQNQMNLLVTGKKARLVLPVVPQLADVPVKLTVWLKASRKHSELLSCLPLQATGDRKYAVGTIHHLSCSGGTVISKCLAAMPNVVLLSEINPCSMILDGGFNPFDPLKHFQKKYPEIAYNDRDSMKRIFFERISWIVKRCKEYNKFLLFRDHSHSDFLFKGSVDVPSLYTFLSELFDIKSIVTLRNPIDSYLALRDNQRFPTDVKNFDHYCQRVLDFLNTYKFAQVFLYEDFVENPKQILEKMCVLYGIEYDNSYKDKFYNITLTGNSGRGKEFKEIKKLERRSGSDGFLKEVKESHNYQKIMNKYYRSTIDRDQLWIDRQLNNTFSKA